MQNLLVRVLIGRVVLALPGVSLATFGQVLYWGQTLSLLESWVPFLACFLTGSGLFLVWQLAIRIYDQWWVPEILPPPKEEPLTPQLVKAIALERLPKKNHLSCYDDEDYHWLEVFRYLSLGGISTTKELSELLDRRLAKILRADESDAKDYLMRHGSDNRDAPRWTVGVHLAHVGIVRMCAQAEFKFEEI